MSIDPIGAIDTSPGVIGVAPLYDPTEMRFTERAPNPLNDVSVLTAGDREFLSAVFGSRIVTIEDFAQAQAEDRAEIQDVAQAQQLSDNLAQNRAEELAQAEQFVADLIRDRQNGRLPIGTELTATYVEARFDEYAQVNDSVTQQNLESARAYFNDRVQGAQVDLLA